MPYKDPEYKTKYRKSSYVAQYSVAIRNEDIQLKESLEFAAKDAGITPATYLRNAAYDKLISEGYLEPYDRQ